jgi:hypothetical protein
MAFNINKMIGDGLKYGVAKTAHFDVLITPPPALNADSEKSRELAYRADSVEIPGRTALTIDHKFSNNGPINKIPYAQIYPDVTITFICSEDLREKEYLDLWMSKMLDVEPTEVGIFGAANGTGFNIKYFEDYKTTIDIRQYDQTGELRTTTKLIEAYPIIINGIQMGWQDESIARVSAQFALRYYTVDKGVVEKQEPPKDVVGPVFNPSGKAVAFKGAAFQTGDGELDATRS